MNSEIEIQWHGFPEELIEHIKYFTKQNLWIVPGWVQTIGVYWQAEKDEGEESNPALKIISQYDYRHVSVTVYPVWLNFNDVDRAKMWMHEWIHIPFGVLSDRVRKIIDRVVDPKDTVLRRIIEDQMVEATEAGVQDLTWAIYNKMKT